MAVRIFLSLMCLLWIPYGIYCFVQPGVLAEAAGVTATTATGTTEIRAMYGGLQLGIGLLALGGLLRPSLVRPALLTHVFLCAGLASTRLLGALLDGAFSGYTLGGLGFEIFAVSLAAWLLSGLAPVPESV